MEKQIKNVAEQWREALENKGYEHSVEYRNKCAEIRRFSRVWRRILRRIPESVKAAEDKSVFEFGCGGGKHLAQFLLNGWKSTGIDCSPEVLKRAKNYLQEVKKACVCRNDFKLICGDFLDYESDERYDIVFNVGVIEHFLDDFERIRALRKMFGAAKENGFVVSIVPSGAHPLRQKMKEENLGGYGIPEINYVPEIMEREMKQCGGKNILILPHNIMGYILIKNKKGFLRLIDLFWYFFFQILPLRLLSKAFLYRHAMTLIAIAQK